MGPIVCATRGGEAGRRTQEWAIALAKEQEAALIFLCVFDPGIVEHTNERLTEAVVQEQQWLGRALLGIALARAEKAGVKADAEVRNGPVLETIEAFLRQVDAAALVIGEPKMNSALAAFDRGRVHVFAERVRQDTGVDVIVVTPESGRESG
jgi:nucleotide-binding universal stress UspA family protein